METEENLSDSLIKAKDIIEKVFMASESILDFCNVGLTNDELASIMAEILEVHPDLKGLMLEGNNLDKLPDDIFDLPKLEKLYLGNNKISVLSPKIGQLKHLIGLDLPNNNLCNLPDELFDCIQLYELNFENNKIAALSGKIEKLKKLSILELKGNRLVELPIEIGGLTALEYLYLEGNNISTVPEQLANLPSIYTINLEGNPLTLETTTFLNTTIGDVVGYDMTAQDVRSDPAKVLEKIFGEECLEKGFQLNSFNPSWSFVNGSARSEDAQELLTEIASGKTQDTDGSKAENAKKDLKENTLKAQEVLLGLLGKTPLNAPEACDVYFEGCSFLMNHVLDETVSESDKKSTLYKIAKALGNCKTPIKDLLVGTYIHKHINSDPLPQGYHALLTRAAVESEIYNKLKSKVINDQNILIKNEQIEQVQGLTNAIFVNGAATHKENKCKIVFVADEKPEILPSKTAYIGFAFNQVGDQLAVEFAKLFCKTDESGDLLKEEDNNYVFSSKKLRGIVEKYNKGLGIISPIEVAINDYVKGINKILKDLDFTSLHFDKPDVIPFLNINKQQEELREKLLEVPDNEVKDIAKVYYETQEAEIRKVAQDLKGVDNSASTTAKNDLQGLIVASNKRDRGAGETVTSNKKMKSRSETASRHNTSIAKRSKSPN